jgi:DNA-binding NarL/FixJ family response regulator
MKILIADDHQLYHDALSILVKQLDEAVEIHFATSYAELLQQAEACKTWALMLVNLTMPGLNYYQGIRTLSQRYPNSSIIVTSVSEQPNDYQSALEAGALGSICKTIQSDDMLDAIKLMLKTGISIPPNPPTVQQQTNLNILSPQQRDVLSLLCQGQSNERIAINLALDEHTVKLHICAILKALNAENTNQAVMIAKQHFSQQ